MKTFRVYNFLTNLTVRALFGLHVGGNWDNSSSCGSACVNSNNVSANRNANNGGRLVSDTMFIVFPVCLTNSRRANKTIRLSCVSLPTKRQKINGCVGVASKEIERHTPQK